MNITRKNFFSTLLVIGILTTSITYAQSNICPPIEDIKNFARGVPLTSFVIDGPGVFGLWAFEVKEYSLKLENREWHLASWINSGEADEMEQARKVALENVLTLSDATPIPQDSDEGYACVYQGQYGVVMLVTPR